MKCDYCKDPIYKFQKRETIPDQEGKKRHYHEGCYEIMLDEVADKVRPDLTHQ